MARGKRGKTRDRTLNKKGEEHKVRRNERRREEGWVEGEWDRGQWTKEREHQT